MIKQINLLCLFTSLILSGSCNDSQVDHDGDQGIQDTTFYFGADLSYVNQILDHNGIYKVQGVTQSPYKVFHDYGTNLVRLRLWHNPAWTKEVYDPDGAQLYNDVLD